MSLETTAPENDFDVILGDVGQDVDVINISRTTDSEGRQTDKTEATAVAAKAVIVEVSEIHKEWLEHGLLRIGDAVFYLKNSVTVNQFDVLKWVSQSRRYVVKEIRRPPILDGGASFGYIAYFANREAS